MFLSKLCVLLIYVMLYIDGESAFANPSISTAAERPQPTIFTGKLKCYQLKVCLVPYNLKVKLILQLVIVQLLVIVSGVSGILILLYVYFYM